MRCSDVSTFKHINGHSLLSAGLHPGMTVLDLGANHGRFSELLAAEYPGSYHAIEANPDLADALDPAVFSSVKCCAVVDRSGPVTLRLAANDEASSVLRLPDQNIWNAVEVGTVRVDGVPLREILSDPMLAGGIDVLKVDIEGAEVLALPTLTPEDLRKVRQIVVEFHGGRVFGLGLARDTRRTIRILRERGFVGLDFQPSHMDMLFVNRRAFRVTRKQEALWRVQAARMRMPRVASFSRVALDRWRQRSYPSGLTGKA